ncbi:hypothetical protein P167DRAFT_245133 [Morchella conica CCBAS932]|uniref:Uncharacterized protein n=1 Tax=Morchella conica CCBAS932 TaxID=1392247 RepID=A0A3N4KJD9_9PEZI|nr:hypothetical protein P167DRAFT_245133 [Morchella conica CCBAS932]
MLNKAIELLLSFMSCEKTRVRVRPSSEPFYFLLLLPGSSGYVLLLSLACFIKQICVFLLVHPFPTDFQFQSTQPPTPQITPPPDRPLTRTTSPTPSFDPFEHHNLITLRFKLQLLRSPSALYLSPPPPQTNLPSLRSRSSVIHRNPLHIPSSSPPTRGGHTPPSCTPLRSFYTIPGPSPSTCPAHIKAPPYFTAFQLSAPSPSGNCAL